MSKKIILLGLAIAGLSCTGCTINVYRVAPTTASTDVFAPTDASGSASSAATILNMSTSSGNVKKSIYTVGEPIELNVRTSVDAFVDCYYQQANGEILKLYPNRFSPRQVLTANKALQIPGTDQFSIIANTRHRFEAFMCLAACEDVLPRLPQSFREPGFKSLPISNFDEMYAVYRKLTDNALVGRVISVSVR